MANKAKGPAFLRFCAPVLETLKERGGWGAAADVSDAVVARLQISERELAEVTPGGQPRVRNQIAWARFYLSKAGLLRVQGVQRGVWALTRKGRQAQLNEEAVYPLFKSVQDQFKKVVDDGEGAGALPDETAEEEPPVAEEVDADDGADGVDDEDVSGEIFTPFDPTKIRIDTRTMTVDLLIRRIRAGEIDLLPAFQRAAGLWKDGAQSRLIESLLTRIPVPAFYMDATDDDHWLVVDGLQRLTVLRRFVVDQAFALTELEFLTDFNGKRFKDLPRPMQRRVEETQVTVNLIQPGTPSDVKFNIFKRINTGGLPLSAQEIRHALNQGPAALMLQELATLPEFVSVAGKSIKDRRMADRECVLRFLAFVMTTYSDYKTPDLDGFLNDQMRRLNEMTEKERLALSSRFSRAMTAAERILGQHAFRKRYTLKDHRKPINKALFECWSVALDRLSDEDSTLLAERRDKLETASIGLMNTREFDAAISQGTGDTRKVHLRFSAVERVIRETLS
jgi:hypothetical protein